MHSGKGPQTPKERFLGVSIMLMVTKAINDEETERVIPQLSEDIKVHFLRIVRLKGV